MNFGAFAPCPPLTALSRLFLIPVTRQRVCRCVEHEVCLTLQVQDPGKHQHLMLGASAIPFPELSRSGREDRVPSAARADPSALSRPALLSAGNPWARGRGGGGGDGGGASRWEEAEAEGHASRPAAPRSQKLSAKLRAAAWLRGVQGRRSGSSETRRAAGAG